MWQSPLLGNPASYERPAGVVENVPLYVLDPVKQPAGFSSLIWFGLIIIGIVFLARGFR